MMFVILLLISGVFVLGVYTVILDAMLAEQIARIRCNRMFRKLGIEPLYSLEDVKGNSIDKHTKRSTQ